MTQPIPRLVGMVHLLPLPGAPRFAGSMDEVVETASADARVLVEAGFPALMVENFGDVPFFPDTVPAETIAAMTVAARAVAAIDLPIGVNVLRNDGIAAVGIAAATDARFVRVNVLTGMMYTDQGPIVGRAAEIQRLRSHLSPGLEIWADVMVKHSTAPTGLDPGLAAQDTVERGLADAVIVSGGGTGAEPRPDDVKPIRDAVGDRTRIVIGSGATSDNLEQLLELSDTVIVGSSLKVEGDASNRPDPARCDRFVAAAQRSGLL